jgi:hypothetical protein
MDDFEDYDGEVDLFVHFDLLTKFWLNERCAPSLLEYQERLMEHTNEAGQANKLLQ